MTPAHRDLEPVTYLKPSVSIMAESDPAKSFKCLHDFEHFAQTKVSEEVWETIQIYGGDGITYRDNLRAFDRYTIRPRVMRDVSNIDTSTTVLGQKIAMPIGISPTAFLKSFHRDGDVASARAAGRLGTVFTQTMASTLTVAEVSAGAPDTLRWFAVLPLKDRELMINLIRQLETTGYSAIVLIVDTPVFGTHRYRKASSKESRPQWSSTDDFPNLKAVATRDDHSLEKWTTWDFIPWVKSVSKLPIIVKGILSEEDAVLAVEHGAAAVWVSNHGGRQLDTVPATIDVLEGVVRAVAGRCEVYLDGGVRCGTDVFKALALGANAVFIGRPAVHGLAYEGDKGVEMVLEMLKAEFTRTMALAGCVSVGEIGPEYVSRRCRCTAHDRMC